MPFSAACRIRELSSRDLNRQLPAAAQNPCVFSKKPSFEFLNSCRLAILRRQSEVANRTPDVAETQHHAGSRGVCLDTSVFVSGKALAAG